MNKDSCKHEYQALYEDNVLLGGVWTGWYKCRKCGHIWEDKNDIKEKIVPGVIE